MEITHAKLPFHMHTRIFMGVAEASEVNGETLFSNATNFKIFEAFGAAWQ